MVYIYIQHQKTIIISSFTGNYYRCNQNVNILIYFLEYNKIYYIFIYSNYTKLQHNLLLSISAYRSFFSHVKLSFCTIFRFSIKFIYLPLPFASIAKLDDCVFQFVYANLINLSRIYLYLSEKTNQLCFTTT